MDSKHRHELKQNELVEMLEKAPEYLQRHWWTILCVILIIAGVGLSVYVHAFKKDASSGRQVQATNLIKNIGMQEMTALQAQAGQQAVSSESLAVLAGQIEESAKKLTAQSASAFAYIKQGDALRSDLHFRNYIVGEELIESQIAKARQAYQNALSKAGDNPVIAAGAEFGLAMCSEELGQFEQASQQYRQIVEDPVYAGTVFEAQAKFRLEIIADSRRQFTFAGPEPAEGTEIKLPSSLQEGADIQTFDSAQEFEPDIEN